VAQIIEPFAEKASYLQARTDDEGTWGYGHRAVIIVRFPFPVPLLDGFAVRPLRNSKGLVQVFKSPTGIYASAVQAEDFNSP